MPATVTLGARVAPWNQPLEVDREDFPTLARTGLHSEIELDMTRAITGRSVAEVTELGWPGRLSTNGFMCEDEDVISVLKGDNRLVGGLGLTHAAMARPLLHVCNMIRVDWEHNHYPSSRGAIAFLYNGRKIHADVVITKGGQKSIFADGIGGAWSINIRRDLDENERAFLDRTYGHLDQGARDGLIKGLSFFWTGEMQPFYVLRYGFYEGHTGWRADPITIAFIFGLRSVEEIEKAFPGKLDTVLTAHFTREDARQGRSQ
jgi:hypothetical protein